MLSSTVYWYRYPAIYTVYTSRSVVKFIMFQTSSSGSGGITSGVLGKYVPQHWLQRGFSGGISKQRAIPLSKAQEAPDLLNVWYPYSVGSRPISDTALLRTILPLVAVITEVYPG